MDSQDNNTVAMPSDRYSVNPYIGKTMSSFWSGLVACGASILADQNTALILKVIT